MFVSIQMLRVLVTEQKTFEIELHNINKTFVFNHVLFLKVLNGFIYVRTGIQYKILKLDEDVVILTSEQVF